MTEDKPFHEHVDLTKAEMILRTEKMQAFEADLVARYHRGDSLSRIEVYDQLRKEFDETSLAMFLVSQLFANAEVVEMRAKFASSFDYLIGGALLQRNPLIQAVPLFLRGGPR